MKTLEQLDQEIIKSDDLKKEFSNALKEGRVEEFAKEHGCQAGKEDVISFMKGLKELNLSEDDLDKVAGGKGKCSSFSCSPYRVYCNERRHS